MSPSTTEESLREDITVFLRRNFPQIKMHGGSFSIDSVDTDTGKVTITLTGACSGCGISPMTIQALQTRLVNDVAEITQVTARTGHSQDTHNSPSYFGSSNDTSDEDITPEAPF